MDGPQQPASQEDRDWETARAAFEEGLSYRQCQEATEGRLSYARIRRRAISEEWASGGLVAGAPPEAIRSQTEAATAKAQLSQAQRRAALVERMFDATERLLEETFSPAVRREVKVLGMGEGVQDVQIVDVELVEPTPADKKALVTSAAILTDKVLLMTGEATSRTEAGPIADREAAIARTRQIRDELAERRAAGQA